MSGTVTEEEKMQAMSLEDEQGQVANKGTAKRDALRANEIAVQKMWEEAHAFESEPDSAREHFLVTFPYRKLFGMFLCCS